MATTQAYRAMLDILNTGRSIDNFLNSIAKDKRAFFDASEALADSLVAIRSDGHGIRFKTGDAEADDFLAGSRAEMLTRLAASMNSNDHDKTGWLVTAMACAVSQTRNGRTFTAADPAPAPPVDMRIVAMPDRETTAAVKYDADGNIKSTTQTERDAPA